MSTSDAPRPSAKNRVGNHFEDFRLGQVITHALPRTITSGDVASYISLFGPRFALFTSDAFAQGCGLERAPIDPLVVFHNVFGQSVPDVSLNAVANLGYAEGRFLKAVYPGDSVTAESEVIGLKQNSSGKTGVVYVRTTGRNQHDEVVLSFCRWVMVRKLDVDAPAPDAVVPDLAPGVAAEDLVLPEGLDLGGYDFARAGAPYAFEDYEVGEQIRHTNGGSIDESLARNSTRQWNNDAKVHYPPLPEGTDTPLVYGGVVISRAKSLSYDGLQNAGLILGINAGRHVNPCHEGDVIYAWSEVLDAADLGAAGALRLRLVVTKDEPAETLPRPDESGKYASNVLLDFDHWAAIPKRG